MERDTSGEIFMKQIEILNKLKAIFPSDKYKNEYYLDSIESNLYFLPYKGIDKRAYSIRSSAAMIYNTIGPDSIILDGEKYHNIEYERELPALNNNDATDHDHSAHLDVSMLSENKSELVLIESKMLEWTENPKSLSIAYLSPRCYLPETGKSVSYFIESFKNLKSCPELKDSKDEKRIIPFYKKYDAVQMNIHILGIYNFCVREKTSYLLPKKIRLLNIVWALDEAEEYQIEEQEGKEYVAYANVTFRNLFKQLGVDFSVEYVRYSDFLSRVDWTNRSGHRNYLRRYEIKKTLSDVEFDEQFDSLWNETIHKGEKQEIYEERISSDSSIKLEDDAFDKEMASHRYNPNFEGESYCKESLFAIDGEEWRLLTNQYYIKYAVSNHGRVAFLEKDGLYHVLEQEDEKTKGYLRLDPLGKYKVDHQIEVYKLIAMGFLGKQIGDGYDVHHKINDGYNCRPENLILLTREQHNKVHQSRK